MTFPKRNEELCRKDYILEQLTPVYREIEKAFMAQMDRADDQKDYWDIWNCKRSTNQFYSGNTKVYLPLVRNAIKARRTRALAQIFPETGRNVAVISNDDESPDAQVALLEHYIRRADLRSLVMPALLVAGDVEGQMTALVTWNEKKRSVVERIPQPIRMLGIDLPPELAEPVLVLKESDIPDAGPDVEIVLDADFVCCPATADSVDKALAAGGSLTVVRRWSQKRFEELAEDGEFDAETAEEVMQSLRHDREKQDPEKQNLETAGIKNVRGSKFVLAYRTWVMLDVGTGKDKKKRLCLVYFAGENKVISAKLCPYWCDKPDIITQAMDKLPGNFKGMSQIKPGVADLQYVANDLICEGLDATTFNLLPVLRVDPDKVPNVDALVMDLMATWLAPAGAIEPIQFDPTILDRAVNAVLAAERMINAALSVTPAQMPQQATNRKPNQAEVAMIQQIELAQTADTVLGLESGLLSPVVERFAEYDAQFRDRDKTVQAFGELGLKAEMVTVPPIQIGRRWSYAWWGVQAARSAQQIQQQIAAVNVVGNLANHPSVAQSGKRLNLVPIIDHIIKTAFSARIAPRIFEDISEQLSVPADLENQMMSLGLEAVVSPLDNDPQHIQIHSQLLQQSGFGTPAFLRVSAHIAHHNASMKTKQAAQMAQMIQAPGGQPGAAGPAAPAPGGQPQMPRPMRQPAGAVHPDQMPRGGGVIPMPRRM